MTGAVNITRGVVPRYHFGCDLMHCLGEQLSDHVIMEGRWKLEIETTDRLWDQVYRKLRGVPQNQENLEPCREPFNHAARDEYIALCADRRRR
jgi:hypothetical protein